MDDPQHLPHSPAPPRTDGNILPHLNRAAIEAAYSAAPGNEIASGKFLSPQSSAALAANAFGLFFDRPDRLPPIPGLEGVAWPPHELRPEAILRFPWRGGRHPCLDMALVTADALIGIESKRYEPFRPKASPDLSRAYWRSVWGSQMRGYEAVRDMLDDGSSAFAHLDAGQLIKHALGLRTAARTAGLRPVLVYLFAEPEAWPEGRAIPEQAVDRHRQEIAFFSNRVRDDDVRFWPVSYGDLLRAWMADPNPEISAHAAALRNHFCCGDAEPLWRRA